MILTNKQVNNTNINNLFGCKMYLVIVLQLLLFLASGKPCTPFGPRMSLGSSYFGGSKEIFRLLFNTNEECNKSYIQINQNVVSNITCEVKPLLLQTLNFSTFIHNCSVGGVVLGKDFEYNVIGVTDDDIEIKFSDSPIVTSLVDPKKDSINQFIVLADWSKINKKEYTSLDSSFDTLIKYNRSQIHGIVLNGDYAYDLDSNKFKNYKQFLVMMSQISTIWPVIMSTGNHEYNSDDDYKLFTESFDLYDNPTNKMQSYFFKNVQFLSIDLHQQIYGGDNKSVSKDDYYKKLQAELEGTANRTSFRVVCSHHPIFCSHQVDNCVKNNKTFFDYWSLLNDQKINLYLTAHVHTYERQYPYYKGKILYVDGPYSNMDSLVSIVEGVAGNDQGLVEEAYPLKDFTVKATFNETGFGILTVYNQTTLEYKHYSATKGQLFDSVAIGKSRRQTSGLVLEIE